MLIQTPYLLILFLPLPSEALIMTISDTTPSTHRISFPSVSFKRSLMAPSLKPILFCFCFLLHNIIDAAVFPLTRDLPTRQYVTQIRRRDSSVSLRLVVDLGGPFLWLDCASAHVSSSGRLPISACSADCARANAHHRTESENRCFSSENGIRCHPVLQNGVAALAGRGELVEGLLAVGSDAGEISSLEKLLFACAPSFLLRGLASGSHGVLGLGRAQISILSQISHRRLTVCLSPSNGVASSSSAEEVFGTDVSRSLVFTPLVSNPSGNYVINVKSVKIKGDKLRIDIPLSAELSTVVPYMTMERSIYEKFIEAYAKAAAVTTVEPSAPFGLCFKMKAFGLEFPVVDMALQSDMVKWRIGGRNLMVDIGGGVSCLGVLDGGLGQVNPIVLGGLQLEDFVLDFDMGHSVLGFAQRPCSDLAPNTTLLRSTL